jgi:hypothetical protein
MAGEDRDQEAGLPGRRVSFAGRDHPSDRDGDEEDRMSAFGDAGAVNTPSGAGSGKLHRSNATDPGGQVAASTPAVSGNQTDSDDTIAWMHGGGEGERTDRIKPAEHAKDAAAGDVALNLAGSNATATAAPHHTERHTGKIHPLDSDSEEQEEEDHAKHEKNVLCLPYTKKELMAKYKSERGYAIRNTFGRSFFLYDIIVDMNVVSSTKDQYDNEGTTIASASYAAALTCLLLSYIVLWGLLSQPFYTTFIEKQRTKSMKYAYGAFWFFFGILCVVLLDIMYCTRFITTDFERAEGMLCQFYVYYERLRYLIECLCEAMPSLVFQVLAYTWGSLSPRVFMAAIFASIYVIVKNYIEIKRGAKMRKISMWAFIKQCLRAGLGTVPYVAGITAGKLKHCTYANTRFDPDEQDQILASILHENCNLQELDLTKSGMIIQHLPTMLTDQITENKLKNVTARGNDHDNIVDILRLRSGVKSHPQLEILQLSNFKLEIQKLKGLVEDEKSIDLSYDATHKTALSRAEIETWKDKWGRVLDVRCAGCMRVVRRVNKALFGTNSDSTTKDRSLGPQPIDVVVIFELLHGNETVMMLNANGLPLKIVNHKATADVNEPASTRRNKLNYEQQAMEKEARRRHIDGWAGLQYEVVEQTIDLLKHSQSLVVADLRRTEVPGEEDLWESYHDKLIAALKGNSTLRSLRLTPMFDIRVQDLRGGPKAKKKLDLSKLGPQGIPGHPTDLVDIAIVCALLEHNMVVRHLSLEGVPLNETECEQILRVVTGSPMLLTASIRSTNLDTFIAGRITEVIQLLRENNHLQTLHITSNYKLRVQELRGCPLSRKPGAKTVHNIDLGKIKPIPSEELDKAFICGLLQTNVTVQKLFMHDIVLVDGDAGGQDPEVETNGEEDAAEDSFDSSRSEYTENKTAHHQPGSASFGGDDDGSETAVVEIGTRGLSLLNRGDDEVTSLSLRHLNLLSKMLHLIKTSSTLVSLRLPGVGVRYAHWHQIVGVVKDNKVLREFQITDGCTLMIQDLRGDLEVATANPIVNYSTEHVRLQPIDVCVMCALLPANKTVQSLDLNGIHRVEFNDLQRKRVVELLTVSTTLVTVDLRGSSLDNDVVIRPTIIDAVLGNDTLRELRITPSFTLNVQDLRGGPDAALTLDLSSPETGNGPSCPLDVAIVTACISRNKVATNVNLNGVALNELQLEEILKTVCGSRVLTAMDLRNTNTKEMLTVEQTEDVLRALVPNTWLISLRISDGPEEFELRIQDLRGHSKRSYLDLSKPPNHPTYRNDLAILMGLLKDNYAVERVNLANVKVWHNELQDGLLDVLENSADMFALTIEEKGKPQVDMTPEHKYEVARRIWENASSGMQYFGCERWCIKDRTEKLHLKDASLAPADAMLLGALLRNNVVLKSLDISSNNLSRDGDFDGINALFEALAQNLELEVLNVSNNDLGPNPFVILGKSLQDNDSLHTLNASKTNMIAGDNYEGLKALSKAMSFNDTLTNINVCQGPQHYGIRRRGGQLLMAALDSNIFVRVVCGVPVYRMRRKQLEHMALQNAGMGGGEAVLLAGMIKENDHSLKECHLQNNCIGYDTQDGIIELSRCLGYMTYLDLSNNMLGRQDSQVGVQAIAEALATNSVLTHLNLAANELCKGSMTGKGTKKGLVALSRALLVNETLEHLDLSDNLPRQNCFNTAGFGSHCVFAYCAMLKENKGLTVLNLGNNLLKKNERDTLTRSNRKTLTLILEDEKPKKEEKKGKR